MNKRFDDRYSNYPSMRVNKYTLILTVHIISGLTDLTPSRRVQRNCVIDKPANVSHLFVPFNSKFL